MALEMGVRRKLSRNAFRHRSFRPHLVQFSAPKLLVDGRRTRIWWVEERDPNAFESGCGKPGDLLALGETLTVSVVRKT